MLKWFLLIKDVTSSAGSILHNPILYFSIFGLASLGLYFVLLALTRRRGTNDLNDRL